MHLLTRISDQGSYKRSVDCNYSKRLDTTNALAHPESLRTAADVTDDSDSLGASLGLMRFQAG